MAGGACGEGKVTGIRQPAAGRRKKWWPAEPHTSEKGKVIGEIQCAEVGADVGHGARELNGGDEVVVVAVRGPEGLGGLCLSSSLYPLLTQCATGRQRRAVADGRGAARPRSRRHRLLSFSVVSSVMAPRAPGSGDVW